MTSSKSEYKGSFKNCHFPHDKIPFIEVSVSIDNNCEHLMRGELHSDDAIVRCYDGEIVREWPFLKDVSQYAKPFILQHALKRLLLTNPDERFTGFAQLLGIRELDAIQKNITSFCTKPQLCLPVMELLKKENNLIERLKGLPSFENILKQIKKGWSNNSNISNAITKLCKIIINDDSIPEIDYHNKLLSIREGKRKIIFDKEIVIDLLKDEDLDNLQKIEKLWLGIGSDEFVYKYLELVKLRTIQSLIDEASYFTLAYKIYKKDDSVCPFCNQSVPEIAKTHIESHYCGIVEERNKHDVLLKYKNSVEQALLGLEAKVTEYKEILSSKITQFLELKKYKDKLQQLFSEHLQNFNDIVALLTTFDDASDQLDLVSQQLTNSLVAIRASISSHSEQTTLIKQFGKDVVALIKQKDHILELISKSQKEVEGANLILKDELDKLAGTKEINLLIELVGNLKDLQKKLKVEFIIQSIKDMKKTVDQFVNDKVYNLIVDELTTDVMEWYSKIKTVHDPDVHFGGFDLEKTQKGDYRSRKVQIKAHSYNQELVSAVSSLSESKLNALGLCLSISSNLKKGTPFDFIVIDDPIQSLDEDHESQFIDIIECLVERGKQIILLSHNQKWISQVRSRCRRINGYYYEIKNYIQEGPIFEKNDWEKWKERMNEVNAIIKCVDSNSDNLQRAEEEIRIIIEDLTQELYRKHKQSKKTFNKLSSKDVRALLIECGVESRLVDRIVETYTTTDSSHHNDENYKPNKERVQRYYSWVVELGKYLEKNPSITDGTMISQTVNV